MIISDLEVLEVVAEETQVEGGLAISDANAYANASGIFLAATSTHTSTYASSGYGWYGPYASASSSSSSFSVAA